MIGSVHGAAAGGGFSLALGTDMTIASDTATFTPAYLRLGTTPDGGGTFFLSRLVGPKRAMEMFLAGGSYTAQEAERLGLVNRVVPEADLERETRELAERLTQRSRAGGAPDQGPAQASASWQRSRSSSPPRRPRSWSVSARRISGRACCRFWKSARRGLERSDLSAIQLPRASWLRTCSSAIQAQQESHARVKSWRSAKAIALLAILAFAIGIGATTAIYTVVNTVLFGLLPFPDADRFVAIFSAHFSEPDRRGSLALADLPEFQRRTVSFDLFGWFQLADANLSAPGEPQHVSVTSVTPSLVEQPRRESDRRALVYGRNRCRHLERLVASARRRSRHGRAGNDARPAPPDDHGRDGARIPAAGRWLRDRGVPDRRLGLSGSSRQTRAASSRGRSRRRRRGAGRLRLLRLCAPKAGRDAGAGRSRREERRCGNRQARSRRASRLHGDCSTICAR